MSQQRDSGCVVSAALKLEMLHDDAAPSLQGWMGNKKKRTEERILGEKGKEDEKRKWMKQLETHK